MSTAAPAFWARRRQQFRAVLRLVFGSRARLTPAVDLARAPCATVWIPAPPSEVERIG